MLTRALPGLAADVETVLQLGDWWMDPIETDALFAEAGIRRVFVTVGNHERFDLITPLLTAHPGAAVRVSEITWILPRPARLTIGGKTVLSPAAPPLWTRCGEQTASTGGQTSPSLTNMSQPLSPEAPQT